MMKRKTMKMKKQGAEAQASVSRPRAKRNPWRWCVKTRRKRQYGEEDLAFSRNFPRNYAKKLLTMMPWMSHVAPLYYRNPPRSARNRLGTMMRWMSHITPLSSEVKNLSEKFNIEFEAWNAIDKSVVRHCMSEQIVKNSMLLHQSSARPPQVFTREIWK